jgi:hypothetical protein
VGISQYAYFSSDLRGRKRVNVVGTHLTIGPLYWGALGIVPIHQHVDFLGIEEREITLSHVSMSTYWEIGSRSHYLLSFWLRWHFWVLQRFFATTISELQKATARTHDFLLTSQSVPTTLAPLGWFENKQAKLRPLNQGYQTL